MFDFDAGKIIIVGVIALIFIPPKDLPRVLRQVGQFVGKMRRMAADFQGQFMDAMREADIADLRQEAQKLSDAARVSTGLASVHDLDRQMTSSLHRSTAALPASEAVPLAAEPPPPRPLTRESIAGEPATPEPVVRDASMRETAAAHHEPAASQRDESDATIGHTA